MEHLHQAWEAFQASYAGLSESELTQPGAAGGWSVRDLIAHVTWWEGEALTHIPHLIQGEKLDRYSVKYGGIDAFNLLMTEQKRLLSLEAVLQEQEDTHRRLLDLLDSIPEEHFTSGKRLPHRLRLDTYGHYRLHTQAICKWRQELKRAG